MELTFLKKYTMMNILKKNDYFIGHPWDSTLFCTKKSAYILLPVGLFFPTLVF